MEAYALGFVWMILVLSTVIFVSLCSRRLGESVFVAGYVALVLTSMLTGQKIIEMFGLTANGGLITFAAAFLLTDLVTEHYGERQARIIVWSGFVAICLYFVFINVVVLWPAVSFWPNQSQFETTLLSSARVTVAGMSAFLVSQFLDVRIFAYIKSKHGHGRLAIRNIASTTISQTVDTVIFITIAFYGLFPILDIIIGTTLIKIIVALIDTPFVYFGRWILERPSAQPKRTGA